jgi:uncharacterized damage-inducible protein DinB
MATRKELLQAFDRMENERQALLKQLEAHSKDMLEKKPDSDSWSVTEVIYHLKIAEEGALKYMHKKLEVGGHSKAKASAGFKQRLLNFMVSLPIKFKAPKVAQLPKNAEVSYKQAVQEWNAIRDALKGQYQSVDESVIGNELFKHPAMGKMNLVQSVRFMRQHMQRHIGQIEKTLKTVS